MHCHKFNNTLIFWYITYVFIITEFLRNSFIIIIKELLLRSYIL